MFYTEHFPKDKCTFKDLLRAWLTSDVGIGTVVVAAWEQLIWSPLEQKQEIKSKNYNILEKV